MPADDPRSDGELVEAANRGDAAAFEALYRRHRDWVARLAFRFTGNREDALDILQETFAYLLRKFPGFELRARLTTFLYPAVKNLSLDLLRRRRREAGAAAAEPAAPPPRGSEGIAGIAGTAGSAAVEEARAELAAAVAALPEGQREALILRFADGLSIDEIAAALEIPPGTVKSRLHHALAALRRDPRARAYFLE